ncbi:MAG TPA: hypothetical protein VGJ84_13335 [Polyangiaceae bacterium]|jgi:hypothetical protein
MKECKHTRVGEAQAGDALTVDMGGTLDLVESGLAEKAVMADALDAKQASVGGEADLP